MTLSKAIRGERHTLLTPRGRKMSLTLQEIYKMSLVELDYSTMSDQEILQLTIARLHIRKIRDNQQILSTEFFVSHNRLFAFQMQRNRLWIALKKD